MNVIFVLLDSVNRHLLEPYGGPEGITPNIQRLAKRGVRFDNHFAGSLPCMPARRELFTGRQDFLWRPWGHLEPFDILLPHVAATQGYKTMMVTDHYHYWEENAHGYIQSFQGLEMIRGYEGDNWNIDPVEKLPLWVRAIEKYRPGRGVRYYRNVRHFQREEDYFSARVFDRACQWVKTNYGHGPFYLQIESFGAHEPFHVPEPYRSMRAKNVDEQYTIWPPYQDAEETRNFFDHTTLEEMEFIRAQYLGKLCMLDHWFGRLLDTLDALNAWPDTMLVVTTDHGHELGERHCYGKSHPHYASHAQLPLIIWFPKASKNVSSRSVKALTSTVDLNPTIIEAMGVPDYTAPDGRSLLGLVQGVTTKHRDAVLYGTYGHGLGCTTSEYTLLQGFDNLNHPLYLYSTRLPRVDADQHQRLSEFSSGYYIPGVDWPVWCVPWTVGGEQSGSSVLYRRDDPLFQERNLVEIDRGRYHQMRHITEQVMEEEGSPPEQFGRLGLTPRD